LTPDAITGVLQDFQTWLQEANVSRVPERTDGQPGTSSVLTDSSVDLHTLLGQFLALRHEVNLQTKAVRSQQETNAEALKQVSQALQALDHAQIAAEEKKEEEEEERLRPFLKTLVDLYDALASAEREVGRGSRTLLPELDHLGQPTEAAQPATRPSFFRRLFGNRSQAEIDPGRTEKEQQIRPAVDRVRQLLGSLLTGYTMSVQRVQRALQQHDLEPIQTVGQMFDPEQMEVIEAVANTGRTPGEVIEEIRRGYLWHGRVFRYALVRVAKP
jgi:molecular chaperone GrpE